MKDDTFNQDKYVGDHLKICFKECLCQPDGVSLPIAGSWRNTLYKGNLSLDPSRSDVFLILWPQMGQDCALDPMRKWRSRKRVVARAMFLGVVLLCPEVQLSWNHPVDSLSPKGCLGSGLRPAPTPGCGHTLYCLDCFFFFFPGVFLVYQPSLFWSGRIWYFVEGIEGWRGQRRPFVFLFFFSFLNFLL